MRCFRISAIFILLCFFCQHSRAEQNKADSLHLALTHAPNDSIKVQLLHELYQAEDSLYYALRALGIAEKANYQRGIATSLLDIGRYYYFAEKQDMALSYLIRAVKSAERIGDKKMLANGYRYIGYIYRPTDPYTAEDYYNKSLKMSEDLGDELSASYALSAIGNIYEGIFEGPSTNNKKALEYYLRSLEIRERKGSDDEIASSLNETSRIYDLLGQYDKGLELRLRGLTIAERSGSKDNVIYLCNVLGNVYSLRLHDHKKGLSYQLKAYGIAKSQKNNFEIVFDITKGIAYSYYSLGEYKKAGEFYQESIILNDSIRARAQNYDYKLAGVKRNLEKELEKQKLLLKDAEILREKARAKEQTTLRNAFIIGFILLLAIMIIIFISNRQKQRLNRELALKNKKLGNAYATLALSENKFKRIAETINDVFYLYNIAEKKYEYISPNSAELLGANPEFFYAGNSMKLCVVDEDLPLLYEANEKIDSGIAYEIEYRVMIKGELKWVAEKSAPIYDRRGNLIMNSGICHDITKIKTAEQALQKKNKDITDSILYARTIQNAILAPKTEIAKGLGELFILSKPKDIVSGDFYFYKETRNGLILAAADCTGHGVPAGFMSMLGSAFLNEILNDGIVKNPAEILNQLRKMIIRALHQHSGNVETRDGMDIALLYLSNDRSFAEYAGAFNPLYMIRDGALTEIKADQFPIGVHIVDELVPFTNKRIDLRKNDVLYLFSDGYYDQFGGPKGRKLMKKQMQELLISVHQKDMSEQEAFLANAFDNWKGELDQVDDVLVIGFRI